MTTNKDEVTARAQKMGFEVLWSPVNQAWVILCHPGPHIDPELVGVKNTLQDVIAFLDDEGIAFLEGD